MSDYTFVTARYINYINLQIISSFCGRLVRSGYLYNKRKVHVRFMIDPKTNLITVNRRVKHSCIQLQNRLIPPWIIPRIWNKCGIAQPCRFALQAVWLIQTTCYLNEYKTFNHYTSRASIKLSLKKIKRTVLVSDQVARYADIEWPKKLV